MKKLYLSLCFALASLCMSAQYVIYPIPQKQTALEGTASFSHDVSVVCDEGIDQPTISRALQVLSEHGLNGVTGEAQEGQSVLRLKVDGSLKQSNKYDSHTLTLTENNGQAELVITGQNTDATFFGLATLEQMFDTNGVENLPCVKIEDYADQAQRGLVEGYYGYPYSVDVKKDLMRFMMRMKMNTYLYGAKSDPYHSEKWKDAYPTSLTPEQIKNGWMSQDMIKDVCQRSAETKVNFIWAIHPGGSFISSSTVIDDIMSKYEKMYKLGVRQFGVFVDDVGVPGEDKFELNATRLTNLQKAIEKKWNKPTAEPADTVKPIHFVPQVYASGFVDANTREKYFTALAATPKDVVIYTTGWGVWSVPKSSDLAEPKKYLGRDLAWWWNYPCNDNADGQLYPMDMYKNFSDMPSVDGNATLPKDLQDGLGIVSNPMQEGELSKISLFSVADYAWNNSGFNNSKSWAASFPFILKGEKAEAFKKLAPYLTKYEPTGLTTGTSAKKKQNVAELLATIDIVKTLETSETESDRLLYNDIRPWVLKLEKMLQMMQQLLVVQDTENDAKWDEYLKVVTGYEDIETNTDYTAYALEGMGSGISVSQRQAQPSEKYFLPYLYDQRTSVMKGFFPTVSEKATRLTNTSYAPSVSSSNGTHYITLTGKTFQPGEYVGLSLPQPTRLASVEIADTLCTNHAVMYSANGHDWTQLAAGETPQGHVKHIVIANNTNEPQSIKVVKSVFSVTEMTEPTVASVKVPDGNDHNDRKNFYDGDMTTWWCVNANQKTGDSYTLTLSAEAPLRYVNLGIGTTNQDYMNTGRVEISTDGSTWKRLSPVGTTKTSFTINDMNPYSDDCKQLYFDGKSQNAKYIRLYNQNANTSKWLRIFEIQPIYDIARLPAEEEICDNLPYTWSEGALQYDFLQAQELESVTVYTDAPSTSAVSVTNDGENWEEIGTLDKTVNVFDMTAYPCARGMKFENAGRVYEVIAKCGNGIMPVTGVGSVRISPETVLKTAKVYDIQGRRLNNLPTRGMVIVNGKKVIIK